MDERVKRIYEAADYIKGRIGNGKPLAGIVLGSGLGKLAEKIENPVTIPYKEIPHFPASTAVGHKGNFIAGDLGGKFVVAMQGRFHYYEGYPMDLVTLPIRVMKVLGIQYLFVSNAAGGVNFDFKVGDLMVINDHINHLPNPLIGPNMEEFGPRFPDMTRPYDPTLRRMAFEVAAGLGYGLKSGVEIVDLGPGKLMEAGATEGFIIQYVNDHQVKTPQDVIDVVKKSKRTVFIEGITPSGRTGYFGFGI